MSKEEVDAVVRRFRFENYDIADREATYWLKDALSEIGPIYREPMLRKTISPRSMMYGNMYFFQYNPKTKQTPQNYRFTINFP